MAFAQQGTGILGRYLSPWILQSLGILGKHMNILLKAMKLKMKADLNIEMVYLVYIHTNIIQKANLNMAHGPVEIVDFALHGDFPWLFVCFIGGYPSQISTAAISLRRSRVCVTTLRRRYLRHAGRPGAVAGGALSCGGSRRIGGTRGFKNLKKNIRVCLKMGYTPNYSHL